MRDVEHRGDDVDVSDEKVATSARASPGQLHDEGDVDVLLVVAGPVHAAPVLGVDHVRAVVAGEDDQRGVVKAPLPEQGQQLPEALVQVAERPPEGSTLRGQGVVQLVGVEEEEEGSPVAMVDPAPDAGQVLGKVGVVRVVAPGLMIPGEALGEAEVGR